MSNGPEDFFARPEQVALGGADGYPVDTISQIKILFRYFFFEIFKVTYDDPSSYRSRVNRFRRMRERLITRRKKEGKGGTETEEARVKYT